MSGDEDCREEEEYTTPLTSPTTASGSTSAEIPPLLLRQWKIIAISQIVQQEVNLPLTCHLGGSTLPDQTTDNDSIHQLSDSEASDDDQSTISPVPPAPRRSARSTKGIPPLHFGKVHIYSTVISEVAKPTKYKETLYVPVMRRG